MADKNNRLCKDPDLAYTGPGDALRHKGAEAARVWDAGMLQEMDSKFQAAMTSAITSGAESAATSASAHFGTRCPVANYSRP